MGIIFIVVGVCVVLLFVVASVIKLCWQLRYAYYMQTFADLPWDMAWECAVEGYEDYGLMFCPRQAAIDELREWTE